MLNKYGESPLQKAMKINDKDLAEKLLKHGASCSNEVLVNSYGKLILEESEKQHSEEMVAPMKQLIREARKQQFDGEAFVRAAEAGNFTLVRLLFEYSLNPNINYQDAANGATAFFGAVYKDDIDMAKYLVKHGIDVHLLAHEDGKKISPLECTNKYKEIYPYVKNLLEIKMPLIDVALNHPEELGSEIARAFIIIKLVDSMDAMWGWQAFLNGLKENNLNRLYSELSDPIFISNGT